MARILVLALAALPLAACQSGGGGGSILPSVGAEVVLRDVTVKIDEASVRLLLTPAEVKSLAQAIDPAASGQGGSQGG